MGKLWILFSILSSLCMFFNPYVGLFSIFLFVQLIIYFAFAVNAKVRTKLANFTPSNQMNNNHTTLYQKSSRVILTIWCVVSIFFFIITTIVSVGVWALGSGQFEGIGQNLAIVSLFSEEQEYSASILLLFLGILFNGLSTVCVFVRRKELIKLQQPAENHLQQNNQSQPQQNNQNAQMYSPQQNNQNAQMYSPQQNGQNAQTYKQGQSVSFQVGIFPIMILILAIIFGACNASVGWLSFPLHFFYLLLIFITKVTLSAYSNIAKTNTIAATNAQYFLSNIRKGQSMNRLLVGLTWFLSIIVIATQLISSTIAISDVFLIWDFGISHVFLILSIGLNVVLAVLLTKSIRNIQS